MSWTSAPGASVRIPSAAASTNLTAIKPGIGELVAVIGYNAAAAVRYIKFYDSVSPPTVGTDIPVLSLPVAATAAFALYPRFAFKLGMHMAMVTGAADNSSAALTAADVLGLNITYY